MSTYVDRHIVAFNDYRIIACACSRVQASVSMPHRKMDSMVSTTWPDQLINGGASWMTESPRSSV
ncbi:hypothetical protein A3216_00530 [Mycobacterium leprae 7935681]|nr:hypothetical protein A3216_00530 [Mycobacterium leprae 7935681]